METIAECSIQLHYSIYSRAATGKLVYPTIHTYIYIQTYYYSTMGVTLDILVQNVVLSEGTNSST